MATKFNEKDFFEFIDNTLWDAFESMEDDIDEYPGYDWRWRGFDSSVVEDKLREAAHAITYYLLEQKDEPNPQWR